MLRQQSLIKLYESSASAPDTLCCASGGDAKLEKPRRNRVYPELQNACKRLQIFSCYRYISEGNWVPCGVLYGRTLTHVSCGYSEECVGHSGEKHHEVGGTPQSCGHGMREIAEYELHRAVRSVPLCLVEGHRRIAYRGYLCGSARRPSPHLVTTPNDCAVSSSSAILRRPLTETTLYRDQSTCHRSDVSMTAALNSSL